MNLPEQDLDIQTDLLINQEMSINRIYELCQNYKDHIYNQNKQFPEILNNQYAKLLNNIGLIATNISQNEYLSHSLKEQANIVFDQIQQINEKLTSVVQNNADDNAQSLSDINEMLSNLKISFNQMNSEFERWIPNNSKYSKDYAIPIMFLVIIISIIVFCITYFYFYN